MLTGGLLGASHLSWMICALAGISGHNAKLAGCFSFAVNELRTGWYLALDAFVHGGFGAD